MTNLMGAGRAPGAWAAWTGWLVIAGVVGVLVVWLAARSLRRTVIGDDRAEGTERKEAPPGAWVESGVRLDAGQSPADPDPGGESGGGRARRGPRAPKGPKGSGGPRGPRWS